jgi:hypothetical protein
MREHQLQLTDCAVQTVAALEAVGSPVAVVIRQSANSKSEDGSTQTIKTDDVVP